MTCIIVDDEPLAVKLLETFVERTPDLQLLGSYTDSIAALDALRSNPSDLLFLDIQMPDLNGMELAHSIDTRRTRVIFTTAFKDYAFESYEVNALDFLLKPIRYVKFQNAINKARELTTDPPQPSLKGRESNQVTTASPTADTNSQNPLPLREGWGGSSIFLKVDGELRRISLDKIIYVEGMKDYLKFSIEGEKTPLVTHLTLSAAEEMLPSTDFMRINRSYIISLQHIRSIDRNDCVYIGDQIIRVTEAYRETFMTYITKHLP